MTATIACPAWCVDHVALSETRRIHRQIVSVGEIEVSIELCDPADDATVPNEPVVQTDAYDWVSGQDLRDYIEALTQAADLLEGTPPAPPTREQIIREFRGLQATHRELLADAQVRGLRVPDRTAETVREVERISTALTASQGGAL